MLGSDALHGAGDDDRRFVYSSTHSRLRWSQPVALPALGYARPMVPSLRAAYKSSLVIRLLYAWRVKQRCRIRMARMTSGYWYGA